MESTTNTRLRIIDAAVAVCRGAGLADLTVGAAAKAAAVSTALVHYHFDTKHALIVAVAERIADEDAAPLVQSIAAGRGLETLDAIWDVLQQQAASGAARCRMEVRLRATGEPALAAPAARYDTAVLEALGKRLPPLLKELGVGAAGTREEVAATVAAFLDGVGIALAVGRPATDVRTAYDAFWLMLIAAGQDGRRR
jgi:AcrR family transcriptional regulator